MAVAVWVLLRPSRVQATVATFRFWNAAAADTQQGMKQRFARVRLSWLVLLLGALAGVVAMAEPTRFTDQPHRTIAVAMVCSAEMAYAPVDGEDAVYQLYERLDPGDLVARVYPQAMSQWNRRWEILPSGDVDFAFMSQHVVNRTAGRVAMSEIPDDVQQTIWFVPSGFTPATRPGDSVVSIPYELPAVTFEAAGATQATDGTAVYVRLRTRNPGTPANLMLVATPKPAGEAITVMVEYDVTPVQASLTLPKGDSPPQRVELSVRNGAGSELARATLTAWRQAPIRIALLGTPSAVLDAYLASDPGVLRVASAEEADIVIAQGVAAMQTGKPTLWLNPPKPPSGLSGASELVESTLASVAVTDAEFGDGVSWASMALRTAALLKPAEMNDRWITVVAVGDGGLIFRTAPERSSPPARREVAWTFSLSPRNTNVESSPAFAVLLANTCRWLASGRPKPIDGWTYHVPAIRASGRGAKTNVPLGIQPSRPCPPVAQQVAALNLPDRQHKSEPTDYARPLMIAMLACWGLGFVLLSRGR